MLNIRDHARLIFSKRQIPFGILKKPGQQKPISLLVAKTIHLSDALFRPDHDSLLNETIK
jgi:hypothetical protein